ncbi:hypothetical protein [Sulfitobacter sp. JB4-11]|uniref:hypothetical protein n=1 Tax=Sulfitobacter rhodophyticola TaxID=3238304 RepID=UPI003515E374
MALLETQAFAPRPIHRIIAGGAMLFGVMTVFSGGNVIFGPEAARELAGQFVPFVVWFNFSAGFFYIAAGLAIWRGHRFAMWLSIAIAAATALVAAAFALWVMQGGGYEMRTVGALTLRFGIWALISLVLLRTIART